MTPSLGKHFNLPLLPATPQSWTLFEPARCPARTLSLEADTWPLEQQRCRARPRGLSTLSKTADANLDCTLVENILVFVVPHIGSMPPPFDPNDFPLSKVNSTEHSILIQIRQRSRPQKRSFADLQRRLLASRLLGNHTALQQPV